MARILAVSVVLTAVLAGFGAWALRASYIESQHVAVANPERTARFASTLADSLVGFVFQEMSIVAATQPFADGDPAAISAYVTRLNPLTLGFTGGLGWVDAAGVLQFSSTGGSTGIDLSDRAYVQRGLAGERMVSSALVARERQVLLIVIAVPTHGVDGAVNGVLAGSLELTDIDDDQLRDLFGTDTITAYDPDGNLIFGVDPERIGEQIDRSFEARIDGRDNGVLTGVTGPSGRPDQVVGFARVDEAGWMLAVEAPESEVLAAANTQYRDSLIFLFLLAFASLAGATWSALRLGRFHREVAESQAQLETVLHQLPAGVVVVDADGQVVIANERAADTLSTRPAPRPDDHGQVSDLPEDEDELWPVLTAVGSRQAVDAELTVDRADGAHVLLVRSAPIYSGSRLLGAAGVFEDITRRRAREREGRALTEVTSALANATSPAEIGDIVVGAGAVALGASRAMLMVRDRAEPDRLVLLAIHGYPDETRRLWEAARVSDATLAGGVVRSGEALLLGLDGDDDLPTDLPIGSAGDRDAAWAALPLHSAGRVVGVLTLGFEASSVDELSSPRLVGFAAQVAQALDRAVRQEVEHDVALALQRSMLSPLDESTAEIRIACRYRPAQDHLVVGGDFFDAIALDGGKVLLAIGDIVGHGLDAAAAMGQLRSATRALALSTPSPEVVLDHLDRFVERVPACRFASAALVLVDPANGRLTYSIAGHPPPVVRSPDGTVARLDGATGPPLGFSPPRARPVASFDLAPGSTTICIYTDGLVERRDNVIDENIDRLGTVMADPTVTGAPVDVAADHVLAVIGDESPQRDDIALIFAEIRTGN